MCGIAGFIHYDEGASLARNMSCFQQHRGPDSQNVWHRGAVALAHQRLSIIDLDARSDQPFEKDGLVIVFNGEIYNYRDLKEQILRERPGLLFRTTSDTEVLLELYRLKGLRCLDDLIGMFAFALYDLETGQLLLARDHFGIKPLFYTRTGNRLAFASELKLLVQTPGFDRTLNLTALTGAMNYLWVPGNESIFQNCFKLPPAHCLLLDTRDPAAKPHIRSYWTLEPGAPIVREDEALSLLDACLQKSIERHMVADVPVSSFLSGGLDSSLISVLAAQTNPHLSTYTIATAEADKKVEQMPEDERYARQLAAAHGFDHHEILLRPDIVRDLPRMVYTLDEPIGDPAAINTYLICQAARQKGVKVLLSGMGADELFFGYRRQKATLLSQRYRNLPAFLRSTATAVAGSLPVKWKGRGIKMTRWAQRFLSFANLPLEEAYMRSYSYYSGEELQQLFRSDVSGAYARLREEHAGHFERFYEEDPINRMCHTDIHLFMLGLNLSYTDRASMAASVEVRVPFIDREVVSLAMRLDGKLKYQKGQSKYILKKVSEKYLPRNIVYRPKASFGAPIRSWISGALKEMVDDLLSESAVNKRGLFHAAYVRRLIEEDRRGEKDNAYRIYQLLTVELWCRNFLDR